MLYDKKLGGGCCTAVSRRDASHMRPVTSCVGLGATPCIDLRCGTDGAVPHVIDWSGSSSDRTGAGTAAGLVPHGINPGVATILEVIVRKVNAGINDGYQGAITIRRGRTDDRRTRGIAIDDFRIDQTFNK